ncbi:MAG TPA: Gfo/Idh/MocA family oxidoreductase, partial [Ardenticatenaceae bacterium]|nr:Gfo/Idh/MocA family oxidoreductase [Ardenticatenaceae bacterium]
ERRLRHAVLGVGAGVFGMHRPALELETVELVAVSDVNAGLGRRRAAELGCAFYDDVHAMLGETRPDVAVILAPHPFHAPIAIACLQAGCHVLVEKPIAVQVAEADAMIEAAGRAGRLLAVNFQQRYRPEVRAARSLVREGRLGKLQHVEMTVAWTRTAAYYRSGAWRGTWAGEGGGVLMNQAPHNLDLLCCLAGMPARVVAWTRTLLHAIETEDTVQAMLEWEDGTLGSLHISTAEAGRQDRLEFLGTGGSLQIGPGSLSFNRLEVDLREHIARSPDPFQAPASALLPVDVEPGAGDHVAVYRNFHQAILRGAPLAADGVEGRMSLELSNAMIYSSYTGSQVELPLDRAKYAALLEELKAGARAGI